ncbi:MAG: hypothetical protein K0Q79_373 [Flavipsychrobacter sp.]|jgi:hypothetical protein|nr:hypothetical protein [Flavipsychrobacter sp.]
MALGRLTKYIDLSYSEQKDFRLLFIQSLLSGFGAAFFFVVASTYFIKKTSITSLPPVYIMSGIFGYLLITLYKRWQRKSGIIYSYTMGFVIYGLSAILLYLCRYFIDDSSEWSIYIAYAGFIVVLPFASMQALGFATICVRIFNISQSKRLLALIGTGEVLASVIAFLIIPFLTKWVSPSFLYILSGVSYIAAIIPLKRIYEDNKGKLDSTHFSHAAKKMDLAFFRRDKFYMVIAIVTVFSVLTVYFADYTYLLSVRHIAAESGMDVAAIVAVVFSVIKIGELLISLLSGNIIRSYGMKVSLMLLPVALFLSSLIAAITGLVFYDIPLFLVFFLLLNKWSDRVIRKGVTVPAMKVVFQVTDPEDRAQLQTSIDGTITQYATILAGALLWMLSVAFNNTDILIFLRVAAFFYLAVFGIWCWFTLSLFSNYSAKIRNYLSSFKRQAPASGGIIVSKKVSIPESHYLVKKALGRTFRQDKESLLEYITYYNPHLKTTIGEAAVVRRLKSLYYNNENFFSRLLIIRYMGCQPEEARVSFVKEYYGVSELQLRVQMLQMLQMIYQGKYVMKREDVFFFTGLCQDVAAEIMSAESAINDISGEVDKALVEALAEHILTLKNLLFELLKVLYDSDSIQVVQHVINSKDKSLENSLFAIELLDNLLDTEMKKLLLPIIEEGTYNSKKESLQKTLLIYQLPCVSRLRELLMNSFMTVGPYIKQLALEEYYRLTQDQSILYAFSASHVENLHATANYLLTGDYDQVYPAKMNAIIDMNLDEDINPNVLVYFSRWGLFAKHKRRHPHGLHEYINKQTYQFHQAYITPVNYDHTDLLVDTFGMALLFSISNQAKQITAQQVEELQPV